MAMATGDLTTKGKVRFSIELTPQEVPTGGGDILAIVTLVTEQNPEPISGQNIKFCCDGPDSYHDEAVDQTTEDGRASHTFYNLSPGNWIISAIVEGRVTVFARHNFKRGQEKKVQPPTDMKVYTHPEGPAEEYFVTVELFRANEGPTIGWPIEVKDPEHSDPGRRRIFGADVKTGLDGAYRFNIQTKKPRVVFVSVVGTNLDYTLKLAGPIEGKLRPPREVPYAPQDVIEKGLLATLKWFEKKFQEGR